MSLKEKELRSANDFLLRSYNNLSYRYVELEEDYDKLKQEFFDLSGKLYELEKSKNHTIDRDYEV